MIKAIKVLFKSMFRTDSQRQSDEEFAKRLDIMIIEQAAQKAAFARTHLYAGSCVIGGLFVGERPGIRWFRQALKYKAQIVEAVQLEAEQYLLAGAFERDLVFRSVCRRDDRVKSSNGWSAQQCSLEVI